jgi:hypothetical protein
MKAFEIFVNGQRLCLAGVGAKGVIAATVDWAATAGQEDIFMHVGGLDGATNEVVAWTAPKIGVGSEITIRIVEVAAADPPSQRSPADDGDDA